MVVSCIRELGLEDCWWGTYNDDNSRAMMPMMPVVAVMETMLVVGQLGVKCSTLCNVVLVIGALFEDSCLQKVSMLRGVLSSMVKLLLSYFSPNFLSDGSAFGMVAVVVVVRHPSKQQSWAKEMAKGVGCFEVP